MRFLAVVIALFFAGSAQAARLGFKATSTLGEQVELTPGKLAVVCFLGTECPMARSYASTLSKLQNQFSGDGVQIVGVMSNHQDSLPDIASYVSQLDVQFPIVHDANQHLADLYGAQRTPEVFLLDEQLLLRYHGRIDNQYAPGVARSSATRHDLQAAITETLAGKPVAIPNTKALGCIIGRGPNRAGSTKPDAKLTFHRDVSRVLARNCIECHQAGEIGPFAMQDYDDVVGWADTMLETIENKRMPPWHASAEHGSFANARFMSEDDKQILRDWINLGMPEGDPADRPKPLPPATGWQLAAKPDSVLPMRDRPFVVPSDGVVEYQYFVVDPKLESDVWIAEAQVVPGARDVVHHAIVFVRPPDGERFRGIGWLTAYVPGQRIRPLPTGHARFVPAGSKFVFQMHYTPIGTNREDTTRLGLVFTDAENVTHEVYTLAAINQEFEIPPNAPAHRVESSLNRIPPQTKLLAVTPHMHYRGKSFQLTSEDSDLDTSILLDVPNYDFNWQHTYILSDPLDLDTVKDLRFDATFDNSEANPFNPDPNAWVGWGDQTWEEMAVAFYDVASPKENPAKSRRSKSPGSAGSVSQATDAKIDAYVARVMKALDANQDGKIRESELPIAVRIGAGLSTWDLNTDLVVTPIEVREIAERIYR